MSSNMDSPDDRGRPEAKGLLRYRSRSAGNFKNSPFYEKFIFFENNAPVKARYSNEIPKIAGESSKDSKGHGVDASSTILYSRDHGTTNRGRAQTERQNKQSRSRELSKDEAPHLYLKRASDINARPLSQSVVELARSSKYASISLEYERPHDIIDLRGQLDFVLPHPKHGSSGKKLQSKSPLPLSCSAETISCSSSFAEKFDRTNEQDPCPSIVSSEIAGTSLSSSISVPCLEALRADESPVRKTSTASIHLSNPQSASKKEERGRKIHVIKTRHSMPHMSIEPSPRLDEWLSSVMKLHTERRRTESWAFPEDDFTCLSFHSPSQPTKIGCSNITSASAKQLPPHNTNPAGTKHPREYWPPQAADNSFSYLSNSGDRSSHASEKTYVFSQTPLPGRKISEQGGSYGPSSSYCSLRCTFHSNQRCSHANHSTNRPLSSKPCACESSSGHYTGEELNKSTSYCIHGTSNVKMPHMCCQITPNVDKLKSSGETLIKCSKSEADLVNPGITIRVTGDEDLCGDSSMKTSCPDCFESSNIVVSESADYVPRGKEITERSILVKGTSPHYIFPGRYLTCDKDSESRDPFSPRNSVGSITSNTSAYSYKSSNADSAVDLCPPDDDQDFEYADFLAKHQAKRFSQADDNGALIEGIPSIDASVIDSLRSLSYTENAEILELSSLNITTPFQQSNCYNVKQELEDYESYIPPHLQDRISIHENEFAVSEQKIESYDSASRRHSASEMSTSRDILLSALDNLRISQKRSEYHTDVTEDRFVESQQRQFFLHDTSTEIMKNSHFNADLDKKQHEEHTYLTQQRHLIPELIVSDHSHYNDEPEKSSCLDELELDSESPLPSRPESSMSYGESSLLDIEERGLLRADSVSSVYSVASTCSTCGYLSEHEVPSCAGGKQSSWRKIRSFILWSPFIQVFKKHRYPWIQLAGHQGNFHAGEAGSVLKKLDSREQACFHKLMSDTLKDFVPEYRGDVEKNGDTFIQLQDLLCSFSHPCVMDVKMGVRTYLEDELQKARKSPTLRKDMYQKMIEIDNTAPTAEENEHKAVTKPRYMQWRDEQSSSVELGFRVEGIKKSDGNSSKDFKKTKSRDSVLDILKSYVGDSETIVAKYILRLKELMHTQENSEFFQSHEIIGSSLLFVHDADENVGVWMIDFGKSEPLPNGVKIDHRSTWVEGNHEDGYLFGLDNMISILEEIQRSLTSSAV